MRPFGGHDVVQHTDRGHQVEAGVGEGKLLPSKAR